MRENLFFSLRFRLVALVLLAVLPALMLMVYFGWEQRQHALEEARQNARTLGLVTSQQFNNIISGQENILYTLSKLPQVKERDLAALNLIFADLLKKPAGVPGYRLADAQGRVLGGVPLPPMPASYADRDWFRRLQETRRFQVSDFVIGKTICQPIMPLAYPVLDSRGEISSVLVASFSLGWLDDFLKKCQLPPGAHALLIDRQGTVLANYPHAGEKVGQSLPQSPLIRAMLDRQEGFVEAPCPSEGIPVVYAFTAVGEGEAPLKLAMGFEKALVLHQVGRDFFFHLSLLGLAAGMALAGSLSFGNLLVRRPVLRILEATRRVAAGDLEARTGLPAGKGELNRLGQSFDEMAAALQQREAEAEEFLLKVGPLQNAIFNSANFSSIATDAKGVIQIFNVGAERMLGYTAAEVVDKITPAEISDPQEVIARAAALSLELETTITPGFEALIFKASRGIEDIYELTYIRKDGSRFRAIVSVTALRDAQGTIIGYLLIGTDNTARKQVEEKLRWTEESFRLMVESVTDYAIVMLDPEGLVVSWNAGAERIKGYSAEEIVGQHFSRFYPREDIQSGKPQRDLTVVAAKGQFEDEGWRVRQDGLTFWANAVFTAIRDQGGTLRGFAMLTRDLTEPMKIEATLTKAKDTAEAANRAKSEFLSSMSHELRTPLNAILGFSEMLQDQHFGPLNEKQSRQISHILTSGRHLLSLINDILDLSKVESGKMTLELTSVGIADLIQNSLAMIKEKALKHQLHLEADLAPDLADLRIVADERKLKQIMFNLLSNAAKYTLDGGKIKVTAKREAGNLVVSVADTGIGIVPEDQERIFEAFEQVDSSYARQQEGTGLGLALTRRMVELHGGRIWVESAGKDQGGTFIFIIPLRSGVEPETLPEK